MILSNYMEIETSVMDAVIGGIGQQASNGYSRWNQGKNLQDKYKNVILDAYPKSKRLMKQQRNLQPSSCDLYQYSGCLSLVFGC